MTTKRSNASDSSKATQVFPLTFEKFLEIAGDPDPSNNSRYNSANQQPTSKTWADGVDYFESVRRLKIGWPEGVKKARELSSKLYSRLNAEYSFQRDIKFDTTGDWFDIGRVLEGEPDCWGSEIDLDDEFSNDKRGKIVRVAVNVGASCSYSSEQILQRGVYALAIVDLLERLGKSVELTASCKVEKNGKIWGWELPLKQAGEELSLDRVAHILGSPSGFRRSWFRVIEHTDYPDCGSSLGCPTDWTESELKQRQVDIYIGALFSGNTPWQGKTDTKFIIEQLAKAGIKLEREEDAKA
ncbi:MAG: hypothetical protein EB133_12795 [Betaproteobacteria bacterium]|nr:hypothetical protein [Betaproteobacteria bacterium]